MGIGVNAISPSMTCSDMVEGISSNDAVMQAFMQRVVLGRT
jgi:meso-butanediol dehydrogenase/(S,S)-butanediol dehydrogenase/diacetyl reductase